MNRHRLLRLPVAVLVGILAGYGASLALEAGTRYYFANIEPDIYWDQYIWGDHWFLRSCASGAAGVWAGFLAGLVARSRSTLVGALAVSPAAVLWILGAVLIWAGTGTYSIVGEWVVDVGLGYKLAATSIPAILLIAGIHGARLGTHCGRTHAEHFDKRRASFLGVRWYHWLWIPLPVWVASVSIAWSAVMCLSFITHLPTPTFMGFLSLQTLLLMLLIIMAAGSVVLFIGSAHRTYTVLAGLSNEDTTVTFQLVKYGLGFSTAAAVLQAATLWLGSLSMPLWQS